MKTLIVVQARTASTRLPGKVLLPLAGRPLLEQIVRRVLAARSTFELVVATTSGAEDQAIRELCSRLDIRCYSGHPTDLLDRHYRAAVNLRADVVIKIPSDCPMIDPAVIDRTIAFFLANLGHYDYVSNLHPATYPDGNDVEVIPFDILAHAWLEASYPYEREHTTPYIWDQPDRFRIGNVAWETGLDYSMAERWTIDYPEDYQLIKTVYDHLYSESSIFSIADVLDLLDRQPAIRDLNRRYLGVNWYRHNLGQLQTVSERQTRII